MGEQYYVPADFSLTDDTLFSVSWLGNNYRVFDGCPDRSTNIELDYKEISPWGYSVGFGSSLVDSSSQLVVGSGCDESEFNITTASVSRSIFDAPNFAPYEPIYFLGFLVFSIFIVTSAFKLILGKGYR